MLLRAPLLPPPVGRPCVGLPGGSGGSLQTSSCCTDETALFDCPIPLLCQTFFRLCVRCHWELGSDPPGHANHCLSLLHVGLKAHTCKEFDNDVQHPLKEFRVPRDQICIVNRKDGKKATISSVITASSSSLSFCSCRTHSLATALTGMLKSLADRGLPCITPRPAQKGDPYLSDARQTNTALRLKFRINLIILGPTPYPSRINKHLSLSMESNAFLRSRKIP